MTRDDALGAVALLVALFNRELSDETATLWATEMHPFDVADAIVAAGELARGTERFPTLAAFLGAIKRTQFARVEAEQGELVEVGGGFMSWAEFKTAFPEWAARAARIGMP